MVNDILLFPATARLTKLINEDKITEPLRDFLHKKFPRNPDNTPSQVGYLITCPWCMSIWSASALTILSRVAPRTSKSVNLILSASYFTGLMAQREDAQNNGAF